MKIRLKINNEMEILHVDKIEILLSNDERLRINEETYDNNVLNINSTCDYYEPMIKPCTANSFKIIHLSKMLI